METETGTIGKALARLHSRFIDLGCGCTMEDLVDLIVSSSNEHWKWRLKMAQLIADTLNFEHYNILNVYIIGSTKNAMAGPLSDIDLMIHHEGNEQQAQSLIQWVDRWGQALAEMNFYRTGHKAPNLIDLHLITRDDIIAKSSYACMIGRVTDGAKLLRSVKAGDEEGVRGLEG